MYYRRVILIVLDSAGIGALPDANLWGDDGANTLANTAKTIGGFDLPYLEKLGLGKICKAKGLGKKEVTGCYGRMAEQNPGKDTVTGHWEMMGIKLAKPFPTYPSGFPEEAITALERAIGRKILGNRPASGTEIIRELGEEHIRTKMPIVYTSADSVLQIAAHETIITVEELYAICRKARKIMQHKWEVGRIIARPFTGGQGKFARTDKRKDFPLPPPRNLLDALMEHGLSIIGFGEIFDVFSGRGITKWKHTGSNEEGISYIMEQLKDEWKGLLFGNLFDFDMLYGHRRDPAGYYKALQKLDRKLPEILNAMLDFDLLILTADHGNDPTYRGTDHTREYVPLLIYSKKAKHDVNLGTRETFADLGKSIAENFRVDIRTGKSFLDKIIERD